MRWNFFRLNLLRIELWIINYIFDHLKSVRLIFTQRSIVYGIIILHIVFIIVLTIEIILRWIFLLQFWNARFISTNDFNFTSDELLWIVNYFLARHQSLLFYKQTRGFLTKSVSKRALTWNWFILFLWFRSHHETKFFFWREVHFSKLSAKIRFMKR